MVVPTADTEKFGFLLLNNLLARRATFLTGAGGAGKTVLAHYVFGRHAAPPVDPGLALLDIGGDENGSGDAADGHASGDNGSAEEQTRGQHVNAFSHPRNGGAGAGSGAAPLDWLSPSLVPLSLHPIEVSMSARSAAGVIESSLQSHMAPRRGGVLGAPAGCLNAILIDDVNVPAPDDAGARPVLELLRQMAGQGGFYDREVPPGWRRLKDSVFVLAAAPPGGARAAPSARLTRLFSVLCVGELDGKAAAQAIFCPLLREFFADRGFVSSVAAMAEPLARAAVEVYARACRELRPTPSRPHYSFSLRDVRRIVAGLMRCPLRGRRRQAMAA
ncbi:unnamed protein product [Phaeothamnion confervicola]